MAWRVFYSYSRRDAELREALSNHLAPLRQQGKIVEWYDRNIEAGADWNRVISDQLDSADLILLLVSADFLASEYCFGVEMEKAMAHLKRGEAKVVPILIRPCLWQDSRFSELQILPRNGEPVATAVSLDDAFLEVAREIRQLVAGPLPSRAPVSAVPPAATIFDSSVDLVRRQVLSYARLYERTRQRMAPSDDRTIRMEQIMERMRGVSTASYPLLQELSESPSPGERLAAVAVLQVFAHEKYLPFLVRMVGSEKPFVGYHAIRALHFAVGALDPSTYPQLESALAQAQEALKTASVGFDTDRQTLLRKARADLRDAAQSFATPAE